MSTTHETTQQPTPVIKLSTALASVERLFSRGPDTKLSFTEHRQSELEKIQQRNRGPSL